MSVTQYIGARYVPLFADPIEWDSTKTYESLTIVYHNGNSYTSRQAVPRGIDITNTSYWALTGNYNAQIETYRREVQVYKEEVEDLEERVNDDELEYCKCYETVAEMKADSDIEEGMIVRTLNYNSNDGGGAYYKVHDALQGIEGFTCITTDNGKKCELLSIKEFGYIDIRWTGAIGDYNGTSLYTDNAQYFNKAFSYILENQSTPIKVIGRYGIASQVNASYSLNMFGEYSPSRNLLSDSSYNLNPISEIHCENSGFTVNGNSSTRTFAYINISNIKFTGSGTLITTNAAGAPSRPNIIESCEASGFTYVVYTNLTSAQFSDGTTLFNVGILNCNFYQNDYVLYSESSSTTQKTFGNVLIQNTVMEHGGGQISVSNVFGSFILDNILYEGNEGNAKIEGGAGNFIIKNSYFESNDVTFSITGYNPLTSKTLKELNFYSNDNTVFVINSSMIYNWDTYNLAVPTYGAFKDIKSSKIPISEIISYGLYDYNEYPALSNSKGDTQCVLGNVSSNKIHGMNYNSYSNNEVVGTDTVHRMTIGEYVIVSVYAITDGSIGIYSEQDSGILTGIALYKGMTRVIIFKATSAFNVRIRATGTLSNILLSYEDNTTERTVEDYSYIINN